MSDIIKFKIPYVILSAVCNTCESTWVAKMPLRSFEKFVRNNKKCICPFCGDTEIGLARIQEIYHKDNME